MKSCPGFMSMYVVFMGYKKNWSHYKIGKMPESVYCARHSIVVC